MGGGGGGWPRPGAFSSAIETGGYPRLAFFCFFSFCRFFLLTGAADIRIE